MLRDTADTRHARQAAGTERLLAVLRSDYMLHAPTNLLLQVRYQAVLCVCGGGACAQVWAVWSVDGCMATPHPPCSPTSPPRPLPVTLPHLLQVELNTIASSFGCLSTLVARMHRYLLGRLGAGAEGLGALPEHNAMDAIVDAMGAAAADYSAAGRVMIMVVQPGERNAYDQQWLQTRLWERHGVRTLRRTLAQV